MRTFRLLLAALLVSLVAVVGSASAASASGESEATCLAEIASEEHFDPEHLTEDQDKAITACFQAPNPMVPEKNEVIWGAFGFFVVFGAIAKFGYPQIKKAMNERTERIRTDLETADNQKAEAERLAAEYQTKLADAKNESARIVEEARQTADGVRRQLEAKAQADIAEMRTQAAADIEAAKSQAMADLRGEVTALAIGAAEQVVQRNLNDDTNRALVEAYIQQVGASN